MRIAVHFNFAIELNGHNILTRGSWRRLVNKVKKRDGATCYHCGKLDLDGQVDHLFPLSRGGSDNLENLVWACAPCNQSKGDSTVPEWRERQAREIQRAERVAIEVNNDVLVLKKEQRENEQRDQQKKRREAQILALYADGMKVTPIAQEVFGYGNSHYIRKVRIVLEKHGK